MVGFHLPLTVTGRDNTTLRSTWTLRTLCRGTRVVVRRGRYREVCEAREVRVCGVQEVVDPVGRLQVRDLKVSTGRTGWRGAWQWMRRLQKNAAGREKIRHHFIGLRLQRCKASACPVV